MASDLATLFERIQNARVNSPETEKYLVTMPDGQQVNAGYFRDNTRDVLEELADSEVIWRILEDRFNTDIGEFGLIERLQLQHLMAAYHKQLKELVTTVLQVRWMLPPDYHRDYSNIIGEVKRYETPPSQSLEGPKVSADLSSPEDL